MSTHKHIYIDIAPLDSNAKRNIKERIIEKHLRLAAQIDAAQPTVIAKPEVAHLRELWRKFDPLVDSRPGIEDARAMVDQGLLSGQPAAVKARSGKVKF